MPWKEVSTMSLREEFVRFALAEEANMSALSRRFGVSRKTGYKWLARFRQEGRGGLRNLSRRPQHSPAHTAAVLEQVIVALRAEHPAWGARKLHRRLQDLGYPGLPAVSTTHRILQRHDCLPVGPNAAHRPWQRFEHPHPNDLWQMDFKGHFPTQTQRCHPLTVLDDHSRYAVGLYACANEQTACVQTALTRSFRRYGLPGRMSMDNGAPWGSDAGHPYTPLTVWLLRLGIRVSHSRPYHPQTQGKDERFHRTLHAELLCRHRFADLAECQCRFDQWRDLYNLQRPHQALQMAVPVSRYQPSPRPFPETLPPIQYDSVDIVRKVQDGGLLHFRGQTYRLSKAFRGYPVGLRPTEVDGQIQVLFCQHPIATIDLHRPQR